MDLHSPLLSRTFLPSQRFRSQRKEPSVLRHCHVGPRFLQLSVPKEHSSSSVGRTQVHRCQARLAKSKKI